MVADQLVPRKGWAGHWGQVCLELEVVGSINLKFNGSMNIASQVNNGPQLIN